VHVDRSAVRAIALATAAHRGHNGSGRGHGDRVRGGRCGG